MQWQSLRAQASTARHDESDSFNLHSDVFFFFSFSFFFLFLFPELIALYLSSVFAGHRYHGLLGCLILEKQNIYRFMYIACETGVQMISCDLSLLGKALNLLWMNRCRFFSGCLVQKVIMTCLEQKKVKEVHKMHYVGLNNRTFEVTI